MSFIAGTNRIRCGGMLSIVLLLNVPSLLLAQSPDAPPAMNFHRIDARLATGGHLTDGGLEVLRSSGVKVVIDLRDKPPKGHGERLAEQGIEWINVPVIWKDPRSVDFRKFAAAMSANAKNNVFVQCQANYRASAMTYMFRVSVLGVAQDVAGDDLHAIWTPNAQWQTFIDSVLVDAE